MDNKNDYEYICYIIEKEVSDKLEIFKKMIIDFGMYQIGDKFYYIVISFRPEGFLVTIEDNKYHGEFDEKFMDKANSMGMDMHQAKLTAIMCTFRKALEIEIESAELT